MQTMAFGEHAFPQQTQLKLLALMVQDEEFYRHVASYPFVINDFTVTACQLVFEVVTTYYDQYGGIPNTGTLTQLVTDAIHSGRNIQTELMPEEFESLATVMQAVSTPVGLDMKFAKDMALSYIRNTRTAQIQAKYQDAMARGLGGEDMLRELTAVSELSPTSSDMEFTSLIADADSAIIQTEEDNVKIPTGITIIDYAIMEGLDPKKAELGIGMAATGVGKTNMLINFAIGAAQDDYQVLFITLELTKEEITQRLISMVGNINARAACQPKTRWTDLEKEQFETVKRLDIKDHIKCLEMRSGSYTARDVEDAVVRWRKHVKDTTGTDEKCQIVMIDWLDLLDPISSKTKSQDEWVQLNATCWDVKALLMKHKLACWTVTQGNRQSANAKKARMDQVAGGFSKMWYVSVALGLTAPLEDAFIEGGTDDDSQLAQSNFDCNRELTINIMKNRNGTKFSKQLYQGPSLKFFSNRNEWNTIKEQLDRGDISTMFGHINRPIPQLPEPEVAQCQLPQKR